MSYPIVAAVLVFILYLASLFGRSLPATRAPLWWIFFALLLASALFPGAFLPVARALGIELVSNMVLALVSMFLVLQLITESAAHFDTQRTCRRIICSSAAASFRRDKRAPSPSALVMLPCYNEQDSLPSLLPRLRAVAEAHPNIDFCFINDCSTDGTEALLREQAEGHFVSHVSNVGVSGGLMTGFLIARAHGFDYLVQCDSDGQHPVERIPEMIQGAIDGQTDMLIGSRFAPVQGGGHDQLESTTFLRRLGGLVIVLALRILFPSTRITDPTSGFRVYSQKAMQILLREMPERYPEPESVAISAAHDLKVAEIHMRMAPRLAGASSIAGLGKIIFMIKVLSALLGLRLRTLSPG